MKKIILGILAIIVIFLGLIVGFAVGIYKNKPEAAQSPPVDEMNYTSYNVSKKFAEASLKMEETLNADPEKITYSQWSQKMEEAINSWNELENMLDELDTSAQKVIAKEKKLSFFEIKKVRAADSQEILAVFDAAPAGRRLRTLAKHLKIDAKRAQAMLKVAQGEVTADAWNKAGDTFEKLENTARVIKDASKVSLYVGGAALSGGATSTAGMILSETGAVIGGADLVLEIGEDASAIALGYNSQAAAFFGGMRKVSEPAASVIGLFDIANASGAYDRFNAVMFGLDQINSAVQENKYLGISPDFEKMALQLDGMNKAEMKAWLAKQDIPEKPDKPEIILGLADASRVKTSLDNKKNNQETKNNASPKNTENKTGENNKKIPLPDAQGPTSIFGTWQAVSYEDGTALKNDMVEMRYVLTQANFENEGDIKLLRKKNGKYEDKGIFGGFMIEENGYRLFYNWNRATFANAIIKNSLLYVTYEYEGTEEETIIFKKI